MWLLTHLVDSCAQISVGQTALQTSLWPLLVDNKFVQYFDIEALQFTVLRNSSKLISFATVALYLKVAFTIINLFSYIKWDEFISLYLFFLNTWLNWCFSIEAISSPFYLRKLCYIKKGKFINIYYLSVDNHSILRLPNRVCEIYNKMSKEKSHTFFWIHFLEEASWGC